MLTLYEGIWTAAYRNRKIRSADIAPHGSVLFFLFGEDGRVYGGQAAKRGY